MYSSLMIAAMRTMFGPGPQMIPKVSMMMLMPIIFGVVFTILMISKKNNKTGGILIAAMIIGIFVVTVLSFNAPKVVELGPSPVEETVSVRGVDYINIPPVDYKPVETAEEPIAIWSQGVENEYKADMYPSQVGAAKALGQQVVKLAIKLNGGVEPKWFEDSMGSMDNPYVRQAFRQGIEQTKSNPDNPILTSAKGVEGGVATVGLQRIQSTVMSGAMVSGTLEASLYIGGKETRVNAVFVEKPWVENLSQFVNTQSGKDFVVGRSKSSCTNAEAANSEAMQDAVDIVTKRLHDSFDHIVYHVNASDLGSIGIVDNSFQQTLRGGITDLYRKAVLLDVSPSKLQLLHSQLTGQAKSDKIIEIASNSRRNKSYAQIIASLLGLIAVICGIYLFVNAATKGYYTIMLRVVCVAVIVIAGAAVVLYVLGHA